MNIRIRSILPAILLLVALPAAADERSDAAAWCSDYTRATGVACDPQRCPCGRSTTEMQRWDRRGIRISICACVSKSGLREAARPGPPGCTVDTDCNDGVWCNGVEQCQAGQCRPGTSPCDGQRCFERERQCDATCEDQDRDGFAARHCGGDDCDDRDPNRYPGNIEICDSRGIDEDCDPRTVGTVDIDGDGFISESCR